MSILYHNHSDRYDYLRAQLNYEIDQDILERTIEIGKDLFTAPMTIGDKFTKASTPRDKNLLGAAALVAPIAVAPFSTLASVAMFTLVIPMVGMKTGIDKARIKWNNTDPVRV